MPVLGRASQRESNGQSFSSRHTNPYARSCITSAHGTMNWTSMWLNFRSEERAMFHRAGRMILIVALALIASADSRAQTPMAKPDLNKLADEAQGWLTDLVRINSVNPPGNEAAIAKYISALFQKEGITNEVIEMAPGRSVVVARIQAGPLPDPSNALLLVAHQDTVGVDPAKWTTDPFAANIRDGYLYGRGSIDDKAMLA